MDLIIHIGLGKTGTTTLQKEHFVEIPGYLGRPELFGQRGRGGGLNEAFLASCSGEDVDLVRWRESVLEVFAGDLPDKVIISNERLEYWTQDGSGFSPVVHLLSDGGRVVRSGPHPIVNFIRDRVVPIWKPLGAVKVLVTLRNQFDWLGSHYAQVSNRIIGASQADFERQVRRIIRSGDTYLDFAARVGALRDAVGADDVTVLLLEDIRTPDYWSELSTLVGERLPKAGRESKRSNQRSSVEGWELRPYDRRRYPLRFTLFGQVPSPTHPSMWTLRGFAHPIRVARLTLGRRGAFIRPNEDLRSAVRAHFHESNMRLGRMLGRDLAALGY